MEGTANIAMDRQQATFGDLRGWMEALRREGELAEIHAEVDCDVELGSIIRMYQGTGNGPAFLFNNIKDYNDENAVSSQLFSGSNGSYSRLAMMFGLPRDTHPRELVKMCRTIFTERVAPITVKSGPVKENVLIGDDSALL